MSYGRRIDWLAEQDPDRPVITYEGRTVSRRELSRSTNRLARAYEELGVCQDDFVTIVLPNGIDFFEAAFAIWKLGATPQPVSYRIPKHELEQIIELGNPSLVVGVPDGMVEGRKSIPAGFKADPALSDEPLPDRTATYSKAMTSGGSTGRSKLIVSENPSEYDDENVRLDRMKIIPERTHLVPGPLYHNGPWAWAMMGLFTGGHVISMRRFDETDSLKAIEEHKVDYTMMVPTMMHRIWRLGEEERSKYDLSSLRVVLHLAAPCPPWLKEAWIEWLGGERVHELYGGTESIGATWISGTEYLTHRGSVGRPMEGTQIKVMDPDGKELPAGEVGEVYMMPLMGVGSTYHYVGAEPKRQGEFETLGDIGWLDEEGYLYLADRRTDLIIAGGANIFPAEVEAAIDAHPKVASSAVIGLPDDDLGQRVHAIVHAAEPVSEDELLEHLTDQLVRYKIPRSIEFVDKHLRDDAGKVRRSALREARIERGEAEQK
jgi:bile acid-coenzyme A ligase